MEKIAPLVKDKFYLSGKFTNDEESKKSDEQIPDKPADQ